MVKNPPIKQAMHFQSLGWEDSLEECMATQFSTLAWRIPWTEEPGRLYSPWCCKELDTTEQPSTHTHTHTQKYVKIYVYFLSYICLLSVIDP